MCLFCDIVDGKIPSNENDYVLCFNDINPVTPVHVLVVPKKHFDNINELASDPEGAVILLDFILTPPGHPDPAGYVLEGKELFHRSRTVHP